MYKKYQRKTILLYVCGGLAIGICVALIVFIIWVMVLRTEYKQTCLKINDCILASTEDQRFILKDGERYPLSFEVLEYYNQYLLDKKSIVFSRKAVEPTDKSIVLRFSDNTLTFAEIEDGTAVHLIWETPSETKHYKVRNENYTFRSLNSYMKNYLRKTEPLKP